jgi:hypothetical protein
VSHEHRIEAQWIDSFCQVYRRCGVPPGDVCALLAETQSRPALMGLNELALAWLGARGFHRLLPTPRQTAPVPVCSTGARAAGVGGFSTKPGSLSHCPAGLVLAPGDISLPFKRVPSDAVAPRIEGFPVTSIGGSGVDAERLRGYFAAWASNPEDEAGYAVSPVGWGLNRCARWDAMSFYDKADFNGTELRAFAGNFLYSIGANEVAGRHTFGHFDLPMRGCTVTLDGAPVVQAGVLR